MFGVGTGTRVGSAVCGACAARQRGEDIWRKIDEVWDRDQIFARGEAPVDQRPGRDCSGVVDVEFVEAWVRQGKLDARGVPSWRGGNPADLGLGQVGVDGVASQFRMGEVEAIQARDAVVVGGAVPHGAGALLGHTRLVLVLHMELIDERVARFPALVEADLHRMCVTAGREEHVGLGFVVVLPDAPDGGALAIGGAYCESCMQICIGGTVMEGKVRPSPADEVLWPFIEGATWMARDARVFAGMYDRPSILLSELASYLDGWRRRAADPASLGPTVARGGRRAPRRRPSK